MKLTITVELIRSINQNQWKISSQMTQILSKIIHKSLWSSLSLSNSEPPKNAPFFLFKIAKSVSEIRVIALGCIVIMIFLHHAHD